MARGRCAAMSEYLGRMAPTGSLLLSMVGDFEVGAWEVESSPQDLTNLP